MIALRQTRAIALLIIFSWSATSSPAQTVEELSKHRQALMSLRDSVSTELERVTRQYYLATLKDPSKATLTVIWADVDLKEAPTIGTRVLGTLRRGTVLVPVAKDGIYWKVISPSGVTGYVQATALDVRLPGMEEAEATTSTPPSQDPPKRTSIAPRPSVVASFQGTGIKNTEPFTVSRPWTASWTSDGQIIMISAFDPADPNSLGAGTVAMPNRGGSGESRMYQTGTFYLSVAAVGDWTIEIREN